MPFLFFAPFCTFYRAPSTRILLPAASYLLRAETLCSMLYALCFLKSAIPARHASKARRAGAILDQFHFSCLAASCCFFSSSS
jgi:hypothetical protein